MWLVYPARFFAGVFLANAIPHFVSGTQGRPFPSPFASPPRRGDSSPAVNVLWVLRMALAMCCCTAWETSP